MEDKLFDKYEEESGSSKLSRKIGENPFMPIGIIGMVIACGVGIRQFKHKGTMSTSLYLMQLRVAAQGAVVGTLAVGLLYSMIKEHVLGKK